MKVVFIIIVLFLLNYSSSMAQWAQSNKGMGNQSVGGLLADGDTLYAGVIFGAFKSTDEGNNWTAIKNGLPSVTNFYAVVKSGNYLVAGGDTHGVWLSSDGGADWYQTTNGVDSAEYVQSFFVENNNVYAAIGYPSAVGVSTDNGNSWTKSSKDFSSNGLITGVTKLGSTLYAVHNALGLYESTNNGVDWTKPLTGIGAQDKNAIITSGTNLCVAATNGVWTSQDSGATWTHALITGIITGFGANGNKIYAVGNLPPYQSSDNGNSWAALTDSGLAGSVFNTMQFTTHYAFINTYGVGVYRLAISDLTGINDYQSAGSPNEFKLYQNFPNPFNPTTKIKYSIPSSSYSPLLGGVRGGLVTLKVYDILGREVATLVNEQQQPGNYEIEFNASKLSSGVYFYRLRAGNFAAANKLILLK